MAATAADERNAARAEAGERRRPPGVHAGAEIPSQRRPAATPAGCIHRWMHPAPPARRPPRREPDHPVEGAAAHNGSGPFVVNDDLRHDQLPSAASGSWGISRSGSSMRLADARVMGSGSAATRPSPPAATVSFDRLRRRSSGGARRFAMVKHRKITGAVVERPVRHRRGGPGGPAERCCGADAEQMRSGVAFRQRRPQASRRHRAATPREDRTTHDRLRGRRQGRGPVLGGSAVTLVAGLSRPWSGAGRWRALRHCERSVNRNHDPEPAVLPVGTTGFEPATP